MPVRGPRGRREHVAGKRVRLLAGGDRGAEDDDADEREDRGGHQATDAPGPERLELAAGLQVVAEQDAGDEEPRQREELGQREEGPATPRDLAVVPEHAEHGQTAHAVEAGSVGPDRGGGAYGGPVPASRAGGPPPTGRTAS